MNPETDLFGETEKPRTRYAEGMRGTPKPWTPQEDLCLLPVLLACESWLAYAEACRFLCETLGREPKLPGKPRESELLSEAVHLIERRTVTGLLSGSGEPHSMALFLFSGLRSGALTWAELERFTKPYLGKDQQSRITLPSLLILLERRGSDLPTFRAFVEVGKIPDNPERRYDVGRPARAENRERLRDAVLAFRDAPDSDEWRISTAWTELHKTAVS